MPQEILDGHQGGIGIEELGSQGCRIISDNMRRVLGWRLGGIAGMAIKPGLQLIDL
jgi:hypothetical protein